MSQDRATALTLGDRSVVWLRQTADQRTSADHSFTTQPSTVPPSLKIQFSPLARPPCPSGRLFDPEPMRVQFSPPAHAGPDPVERTTKQLIRGTGPLRYDQGPSHLSPSATPCPSLDGAYDVQRDEMTAPPRSPTSALTTVFAPF